MLQRMKKVVSMVLAMSMMITTIAIVDTKAVQAEEEDLQPVINEVTNLIAEDDDDYVKLTWNHVPSQGLYDEVFDIYVANKPDGEFKLVEKSYAGQVYYDEPKKGITHYYKVVVHGLDYYDNDYYSDGVVSDGVKVPLLCGVINGTKSIKGKGIEIEIAMYDEANEYNIYRSDSRNGTYAKIATRVVALSEITKSYIKYIDQTALIGKQYYYIVAPVAREGDVVEEGAVSDPVAGKLIYAVTKISSTFSKKPCINTIKWNRTSDANGYKIYCSKKNKKNYKLIKTIKGNKTCKYTHRKLTNGVAYNYKVVAYKNTYYGRIEGNAVNHKKYCDYYTYKDESYSSKRKRIFGKKGKWYKSDKKARKHMKTVIVKVWDKQGGKWFSRRFYLQVNKALAPSVKKCFKEIYKARARVPIHEMGCYSWRGKGSTSEHCIGAAMDINSYENYMIDGGKVLAGGFWKPKKNKYSIPLKCKMVTILRKYGFERGFWGDRKDYMHFSYFGG